ncbi:hypothetical protein BS47DRAFT_1369491 [Hydnum rufescens UP504]|uniref:Uncharacterized protein n=1 Tax=Hydnum rufescens UP504 TaxID=1448309 RepID=A0A9P6ADT4_9AGAM|nr:hypothetical protein BS47DRAFT_1369491 [Hydnum rufescens UP504]
MESMGTIPGSQAGLLQGDGEQTTKSMSSNIPYATQQSSGSMESTPGPSVPFSLNLIKDESVMGGHCHPTPMSLCAISGSKLMSKWWDSINVDHSVTSMAGRLDVCWFDSVVITPFGPEPTTSAIGIFGTPLFWDEETFISAGKHRVLKSVDNTQHRQAVIGTQREEGAQCRQAVISKLFWSENTEQGGCPKQTGYNQQAAISKLVWSKNTEQVKRQNENFKKGAQCRQAAITAHYRSKKLATRGRGFFRCAKSNRCGFWAWSGLDDVAATGPFASQVETCEGVRRKKKKWLMYEKPPPHHCINSAGVVGGPDTGRQEFDGPTVDMAATHPDHVEHMRVTRLWVNWAVGPGDVVPALYWILLGRWGNCGSEGDGLKSTTSSKFSGKVMGPLTLIGPVNIAFGPNWDKCHCGIVAMTLGTQQEGAQHRQAAISELVWSENTEQDERPMQAGHDQQVGLE